MKYMVILLTLSVSVLFTVPFPARADWLQAGNPVCTAIDMQRSPIMVSDNSGGAILVWKDYRNGTEDIYAQRVDYGGTVLWTIDGIAVCAAENRQTSYRICADGNGGAIISWHDHRSDNDDIYAQRIDADGNMCWQTDGSPVCTMAGDQRDPAIAPNGDRGAIIAWKDPRDGTDDVYAQNVDSDGNALWAMNGIPVSTVTATYPDVPQRPEAIPDGIGGAIISWSDRRTGINQLYIQKLDDEGTPLWTPGGVTVYTTQVRQEMHKLVSDGSGGAILTWQMYRLTDHWTDIYAQRVTSEGSVAWDTGGVPICSGTGAYNLRPRLSMDGSGGAYITWEDSRSGNSDVYAQRVNADGTRFWTNNGIGICTATDHQNSPVIATVGTNNAVIAWQDFRDELIYIQRIDENCNFLWNSDGIPLFQSLIPQSGQAMISDGANEVIIGWNEARVSVSVIFCAKIDEDGNMFVETLLFNHSSALVRGNIEVQWKISESAGDPAFTILRSMNEVPYVAVESPRIDRNGGLYIFTDTGCEPGTLYRYRVLITDEGAVRELFTTDAIDVPAIPPNLYQNYPNPFNPATRIRYYLPEAMHVRLEIFDPAGKTIDVLIDGMTPRGHHEIPWSAVRDGRPLASGVYFYRLSAGKETMIRKMVLLR